MDAAKHTRLDEGAGNARGAAADPLAARLAPLDATEIDAMNDAELAELMGVSLDEFAAEPAWTWREAAKAGTDRFADAVAASVDAGRTEVLKDPAAIRRRLGGRPRVGGASGAGASRPVRVRVTDRTRAGLEAIAAERGRRLSDISREASDEYVRRNGRPAAG